MKVIIIFGCPGSGKTTLSRQIKSDFVLEADSFQNLQQFQQDDWKQSRLEIKFQLEEILKEKKYQTIIIDDDFLLLSQRKHILHICQRYKTSYIEILLEVSSDELIKRNSIRDINKRLDQDVLEILISKFEKKSLKNTINYLENEGIDYLEETIKKIDEQHQIEFETQIQQQIDKVEQQTQNIQNIKHQTDLELRKLISQLCQNQQNNKNNNYKIKYDPKYLSLKKKEFLLKELSDNIEENIFHFLKYL